MKIKSLLLATLLCATSTCFANDLTKYFDTLAKQKKVEYVKVNSMMLKLSKAFMPDLDLESVEIINIGKCDQTTKEKITEEIQTLEDPEYESIVKSDDKGRRVKVFFRTKEKVIEEIVTYGMDDKNGALFRMKGKIKPEDLEKIAKHPSK